MTKEIHNLSKTRFGVAHDGISNEDFVQFCMILDEGQFEMRFRHPFLIATVPDGTEELATATNNEPNQTSLCGTIVFFVKKSGKNVFNDMITIGETDNNDIVLKKPKISSFHAYVQQRGAHWVLCDSGSQHGTYVQSRQLEPHKPCVLNPPVKVNFGSKHAFHFMNPRQASRHFKELLQGN